MVINKGQARNINETEVNNSPTCPSEPLPLLFPLLQRPEWRRDPRAITFLKTFYKNQTATKQWIGDDPNPIDYDDVEWWRPFVALPNNLEELGEILARAETLPAFVPCAVLYG